MAISGDKRKTRMKMGAKKVAPPTPEAIAVVATMTATGNMNQYSRFIGIASLLLRKRAGLGFFEPGPASGFLDLGLRALPGIQDV